MALYGLHCCSTVIESLLRQATEMIGGAQWGMCVSRPRLSQWKSKATSMVPVIHYNKM